MCSHLHIGIVIDAVLTQNKSENSPQSKQVQKVPATCAQGQSSDRSLDMWNSFKKYVQPSMALSLERDWDWDVQNSADRARFVFRGSLIWLQRFKPSPYWRSRSIQKRCKGHHRSIKQSVAGQLATHGTGQNAEWAPLDKTTGRPPPRQNQPEGWEDASLGEDT